MQLQHQMDQPNTPRCDDVRELGCVGGDLHCDRLKEHEFLVDTDGVCASSHVLQTVRAVLLADDCEDKIAK